MDTLVRPGRPIPPGASDVHPIVDENVQNAPAFGEVIERFRGADFYVAHNCKFERRFFASQGIEHGRWDLLLQSALRIWPERDGHNYQDSVIPSTGGDTRVQEFRREQRVRAG